MRDHPAPPAWAAANKPMIAGPLLTAGQTVNLGDALPSDQFYSPFDAEEKLSPNLLLKTSSGSMDFLKRA